MRHGVEGAPILGAGLRAIWGRRSLVVPAALVLDSLAVGSRERETSAIGYQRILRFAEEILWTDTVSGGLRFALAGGILPLLVGRAARFALGDLGSEALMGAACVGLRALREQAVASAVALEQRDIDGTGARADASSARAAVESIATGFAEDVCGALLYLNAAGSDGLLAYRAVNAIGATVGHAGPANARFGVVPGRLHAAFGWLPSQVGALAVCGAAHGPTLTLFAQARRDAMAHPRPSVGIMHAAFAHALGIGLGARSIRGEGLSAGLFGNQEAARPDDIRRALALAERAAVLVAFWLMVADAGLWLMCPRRSRGGGLSPWARRGRSSCCR